MGHPVLAQHGISDRPEALRARWEAAVAAGDFGAAFAVSDAVLAARDPAERDDSRLPYHLRWVWDGRPFEGKRVLVRCYHGLGDTVQFCRYLRPLRRRVRHLTLEAQPELAALLASIGAADLVLPFDPARPSAPAECDLEIMELAHALRLAPSPVPYLTAAALPCATGALRVGLCLQSRSTWQPDRSVPTPLAAPLLATRGVEFVSLQPDAFALPGLAADCPATVVGTARRIAGLDLVITIDTMVAHLAGALSARVWLLLRAEPDWRWRHGWRSSVWYRSIRKYRQPRPGDWAAPLRAVCDDLTQISREGTLLGMRGC